VRNGRKAGAFAGAAIFLGTGLFPVLIVVNIALLQLVASLGPQGGLLEPGTLLHIIIGLGTAFTVLLIGSLFVMVGAMIGAFGSRIYYAGGCSVPRSDDEQSWSEEFVTLRHGRISPADLQALRKRLAFLDAHEADIHSVVVVGSTAYGLRDPGSDIDIVIIATDGEADRVREFLFEREIDDAMAPRPGMADFDFTVLAEKEVEQLYATRNPFSAVIGLGIVLRDDGFLEGRGHTSLPDFPSREYYFKTLYENVACQYLGALRSLETESREKGCTATCCRDRSNCPGLSPPDTLRRTVMRMLYATLPARGYLPLTRSDALVFAEEVYGEGREESPKGALAVLASREKTFYFSDYLLLKGLARVLFRELLRLVGIDREVRRVLSDARNLVHGRYMKIRDRALRGCAP